MLTKLYIGTELADYNDRFNVLFSIGDIRNSDIGNNNKSYTLSLPNTRTNRNLLKHINQPDSVSEPDSLGRLYLGEILVISGKVKVLDHNDTYTKIIIDSDGWIDGIKDKKLTDLDLSAYDHTFSAANIEASWSASYPAYRYPMIYFGGLVSGESGSGANWLASDFIPMVSIVTLINKILEPYNIVSSWLSESFVKDLFLACSQKLADADFTKEKKLLTNVDSYLDNYDTFTGSGVFMVDIAKNLELPNETTDEGADWVSDTYTVPVTGTYRFKANVICTNTGYGNPSVEINDEILDLYIRRNSTDIATHESPTYSSTELIDAVEVNLDTGYFYAEAGDTVKLYGHIRVYATATGTQTVSIYTNVTTYLENTWSESNRFMGTGYPVELDKILPDMTQLDFLSRIKGIFNLKFWLDKSKNNLYIEPWDSFVTGNVINLTDKVDNADFPAELISQNFGKKIIMRFAKDNNDVSFSEYLKTNDDLPGQKEINLTSNFASEDTQYMDCEFPTVMTGKNYTLADYTLDVPVIWKDIPIYPFDIYERLGDFNPRIVEWKGLTSGLSWYFEGASKSTYPKIAPLDFSAIFTSYWIKHFHYIDKGKLYTVKVKITPSFLNQFFTVVDTAGKEAFRATYCIEINGINNYFYLQKMTTDGSLAELELIRKQ